MPIHDQRYPGESDEYRSARNALLEAEIALRAQIEAVAEKRRNLPLGGRLREDYLFHRLGDGGTAEPVRFSELFQDGKDSLLVYSFMLTEQMGSACVYCSSFIDALAGQAEHVDDRSNLVVVAPAPIERFAELGRKRGWNRIRILSSHGTTYDADYLAANADGAAMPMINVFARREAEIFHTWGSEMLYARLDGHPRHVDSLWPLWNLFDLTPEGRGEDWHPKLEY